MSSTPSPNVFISYSHDSAQHKSKVLELAERLRTEGINCVIDQYVPFPPEGWPAWMDREIRRADFVLVVATETYFRRVTGEEKPGVGKGAKWEGAIISGELYEREGRNEKFVPVVLGAADIQFVPRYLRQYTRYSVENPEGYIELYRLLTRQPAIVPAPLGTIRQLETASREAGAQQAAQLEHDLVLLSSTQLGIRFFRAMEIKSGKRLRLRVSPDSGDDAAFLAQLRDNPRRVGVAYGLIALLADVEDVEQTVSAGRDSFEVSLTPVEENYTSSMEMATTNYSADDIAELRARRILLDDKLPKGDQMMLGALVSGMNRHLEVDASPIPDLFTDLGSNTAFFLAAARLVSVLWLRLSGTVEFVLRLDLALEGEQLAVSFEGQRARQYSNHDPTRIGFSGECNLRRDASRKNARRRL